MGEEAISIALDMIFCGGGIGIVVRVDTELDMLAVWGFLRTLAGVSDVKCEIVCSTLGFPWLFAAAGVGEDVSDGGSNKVVRSSVVPTFDYVGSGLFSALRDGIGGEALEGGTGW